MKAQQPQPAKAAAAAAAACGLITQNRHANILTNGIQRR